MNAADTLRELLATRPAMPNIEELTRWWRTSARLLPDLLDVLEVSRVELRRLNQLLVTVQNERAHYAHEAGVAKGRLDIVRGARDRACQIILGADMTLCQYESAREILEVGNHEVAKLVDDESRCAVCQWPIAESVKDGCIRGSCSQRPRPERLYAPARAAAELAALVAGRTT